MTLSAGMQLLNVFKDPLLKVSKDMKEEFLHIFDNGLREYIDNYFDKYNKTKTFIYRDEKVNFYDVFYPVHIRSRTEEINSVSDIKKLFFNRRFITIIGIAGSGKSMLMKHIFLSAVNQTYRIPIVIELRNLNDYNGSINDYVSYILTRNNLANTNKIIDRILLEGNFIFLFDGYDEIYSKAKDRITTELEEFVDTYNKNTFVVTSRPGSNAESLQRFDNFYVKPLNKKQINEFVCLQFNNHESHESVDRILQVIEKPENKDYRDYLANPLLLSMFIFTFNAYPELPKYKNKFYWNVFDTLCTKHDSFTKKGFWLHERKSKLRNDEFENILKWLSYITIFKGKYNFDYEYLRSTLSEIKLKLNITAGIDDIIYDLTVSISILIQDGTDYTFPHKSLQEYFTATLIKGLNENQKQKIYTEKFKTLQKLTTGGNLNFYNLCFEIDKSYFSKYFLIPSTKVFIKKIKVTTDDSLTRTSIKAIGIRFLISKDLKIGGYSVNNSINDSYLAFFNLPDVLPSFTKLNRHVKIISGFMLSKIDQEEKSKFVDFTAKNQWESEMSIYFKVSSMNVNFKKFYDDLNKKLNLLELEVDHENISTSELLDI